MASNNQKAREATEVESSSPRDALIGPLFSGWPDIGAMLLGHMDPTDRSLFAGVSPSIRGAVMKSENPSDASTPLPVAGVTAGIGLDAFTDSLKNFRYGALTYPCLLSADKNPHSGSYGMVCSMAEPLMCCARPGRSGVRGMGLTQPNTLAVTGTCSYCSGLAFRTNQIECS